MTSKQRFAWPYASPGGSASSGMIGAVRGYEDLLAGDDRTAVAAARSHSDPEPILRRLAHPYASTAARSKAARSPSEITRGAARLLVARDEHGLRLGDRLAVARDDRLASS